MINLKKLDLSQFCIDEEIYTSPYYGDDFYFFVRKNEEVSLYNKDFKKETKKLLKFWNHYNDLSDGFQDLGDFCIFGVFHEDQFMIYGEISIEEFENKTSAAENFCELTTEKACRFVIPIQKQDCFSRFRVVHKDLIFYNETFFFGLYKEYMKKYGANGIVAYRGNDNVFHYYMKKYYEKFSASSFEEGKDGHLGAICTPSSEGGIKVKNGFTSEQRKEIWENRKKYRDKEFMVEFVRKVNGKMKDPSFSHWC